MKNKYNKVIRMKNGNLWFNVVQFDENSDRIAFISVYDSINFVIVLIIKNSNDERLSTFNICFVIQDKSDTYWQSG